MESKTIISEHHKGCKIPIHVVLSALASQENCDGEPYDQMEIAADYIMELETRITELEVKFAPYEEMEKRLYKKIEELDKQQKEGGKERKIQ